MSEVLRGKPVADALDMETAERTAHLKEKGVCPTLAILRVGERAEDMSYEYAALQRAEKLGIKVHVTVFPADADQDTVLSVIRDFNADPDIHGILLMRPLPESIDEQTISETIFPRKDMDGVTRSSMASVYAGSDDGFAPCTAQACIALLDHYGVTIRGKRATVIGRSLVIGRPVAALLTARDATVTLCHSRTADLSGSIRDAELIVTAMGRAEYLHGEVFHPGQIVLDVGINYSQEKNEIVGDVAFDEAASIVRAITPVPGGVGSVTTAVLCRHVVLAAEKTQ